jgi:hypothetical protein
MCSIQLNPKILEHVEKNRKHCLWNKKTDDGEKCNSLAACDMVCVTSQNFKTNKKMNFTFPKFGTNKNFILIN